MAPRTRRRCQMQRLEIQTVSTARPMVDAIDGVLEVGRERGGWSAYEHHWARKRSRVGGWPFTREGEIYSNRNRWKIEHGYPYPSYVEILERKKNDDFFSILIWVILFLPTGQSAPFLRFAPVWEA